MRQHVRARGYAGEGGRLRKGEGEQSGGGGGKRERESVRV